METVIGYLNKSAEQKFQIIFPSNNRYLWQKTLHSSLSFFLYIKNAFGGCEGNLKEDSQTDSGIMDCGSQKEYLEKRASLFPGGGVDLLKEPGGGLYEDKSG